MMTYSDAIAVFMSTDDPDATALAQNWLRRLEIEASAARLLAHINREGI